MRITRSVEIAKAMAVAVFDWLFLDMEHGVMSLEACAQISTAALDAGIAPIARVPNGEYAIATRALDNGALGIVMPHVDTAAEANSIVNIASGAALRGSPRGVHYVASKGGILSLTRAMALELAPYRIRVNAIAPGLTDTAQPRYGSSEAELVEMARSIPLGRMAQPDEIARAAVFLASENAGFVTGQTLHVNGGSYLA